MRNSKEIHGKSVALAASLLLCAACGSGGSSSDPIGGNDSPPTTSPTTPGTSTPSTPPATPTHTRTAWSGVIDVPLVPAAAANLPDGKILTWSAYAPELYGGENQYGHTFSAIFDPVTQTSQTRQVNETNHDMFCPGTTMLADGRLLINGGSTSAKTTIYDPVTNAWNTAAEMQIPRGYSGNSILSDGSVFTLGGAWSGGASAKNGEVWTEAGGWRVKSGIPIDPFIGPDPRGTYRGDNHAWLFAQADGRVFHAGPSANMHWIDTKGNGSVSAPIARGDDTYSMNGNAVMYDIGKILKTGGAPAYEDIDASPSAYIIDLNGTNATTRKVAPMNYARAMHNSVVLPNGQVVISGGQTYVKLFSDERSVMMVELWDPKTETFTKLSTMQVPRNYHSVSLLLPDGRVMMGGGGLNNVSSTANHLNVEIMTPPYLLNADGTPAARPAITSAPTSGTYGANMTVVTDSQVSSFVLMRLSAVTHSLNNDQRRVPLQSSSVDGRSHILKLPSNAGVAPPGNYMLFALNANGVPSVATTVRIR